MTQGKRDIRRKLKVLEHARETGNVAKTVRHFGIFRATRRHGPSVDATQRGRGRARPSWARSLSPSISTARAYAATARLASRASHTPIPGD